MSLLVTRSDPLNSLVEDRHATQLAAEPFRVIGLKFGEHRFKERSNEWDLEGRAYDRALLDLIAYCMPKSAIPLRRVPNILISTDFDRSSRRAARPSKARSMV